MRSIDISKIFDSLAVRFPVCMASDEFHFFPQARAKEFDWSKWDDFSPDALAETVAQLDHWEQLLDSQSMHSLPSDQEIDLSMTGQVLRTLREQFELVRVQETQPTFYLTIIGIGMAEAIASGSRATEKRIKSLPRFVDQAIVNLISVPQLFLEIGMEMLAELQKWINSLLLPEVSKALTLNALQQLGKHLNNAKGGDEFLPSIELYERIAIEHMGCRIRPDKIAYELEAEINETQSILTHQAAAIAPEKSWQAVIEGLFRPPLPPGGISEAFRETIAELRDHCVSNGMITKEMAQKCPVNVETIPDYMRPVRTNAAYSMPPVHPPRGGTFFVHETKGADGLPADYRLLAAHETFPGHHLLDTSRWSQKRPARRHIEFPIFYEGWASFAEELLFETGLFSGSASQMLMAKRRFWRAVRGKVDFDIHTRRRTLDQAAEFLVLHGMPPDRAGKMVRRYCLKPGYQLSYTIGRRRFRELYAATLQKEKGPAAFARRILALGEIGFNHLEQVLQ